MQIAQQTNKICIQHYFRVMGYEWLAQSDGMSEDIYTVLLYLTIGYVTYD